MDSHFRGDTWGSNRLLDLLMTETIPLFTNEQQYNILPNFIPFREMSYLINVTTKEAFYESLDTILELPESEYQQKLNLIRQYAPYFDHTHVARFDGYMSAFAKALTL